MFIKSKDSRIACSELLAFAILEVMPQALIIKTFMTSCGFGSSFSLQQPLDDHVTSLIEESFRRLLKSDVVVEPIEMMQGNAGDLMRSRGQVFLADAIKDSPLNIIEMIRIGDYYGCSRVDSVVRANELGEGKILRAKKFDQVYQIEGVLCANKQSLKKFIKAYARYEEVNHQVLGLEQKLFFRSGADEWIWSPKGEIIRNLLKEWWFSIHSREGYAPVSFTTTLSSKNTQQKANDFYKIVCFEEHAISNLPIKYCVFSEGITSHNFHEDLGLLNVSPSIFDEAYLFCLDEQLDKEVISSLQFLEESIKMFAIDCQWYLVRDNSKTSGNRKKNGRFLQVMRKSLDTQGVNYLEVCDQERLNWPRIEAHFVDSLGREWIGPSIEILENGESLQLKDVNGKNRSLQLIKRSLFGSLERFLAILLEKNNGALPIWLTPNQVRVIPVGSEHWDYAQKIVDLLRQQNMRVSLDISDKKVGSKVFAAKNAKIPYIVLIGDKELKNGTISVSTPKDHDVSSELNMDVFLEKLHLEMRVSHT